jgi:CheY-like chemotaxis protein
VASGITDGLAVLRAVRPDACVLFLPARDTVEDRIADITAGDDYVSKPFSPEEVGARVRGLLRRAGMARQSVQAPLLTVGDLVMDEDARQVTRAANRSPRSARGFRRAFGVTAGCPTTTKATRLATRRQATGAPQRIEEGRRPWTDALLVAAAVYAADWILRRAVSRQRGR